MTRALETIIAAGISAVLALGYLIAAGRALGPVAYADFAAALSVIYFFAMILTPVTPTLARVIAAMSVRNESGSIAALRSDVLRQSLFVAGAISVLGAIASPIAAHILHFQSSLTFALAVAIAAFFALLSIDRGVLHGLLMFRDYNVSTIVETGVRLAGALALFTLARRSATLALWSYAAGVLLAEVIIALRLRSALPEKPDAVTDWRPLKRLAAPMVGLMLAVAVFQNADMLVVKRWFANEQSGQYGAATALARSFGVLFVPLYVLAGPILTRAHEEGRRIVRTATALLGIFLALSIIPLALLIARPELIMRLLYGEAFVPAAHLVAPLGGAIILMYCSLMLVQVLITVHSFAFLRIYGVVAVLQTIALLVHHDSFRDVISVLYAGQAIVLAGVIVLIRRFSVLDHAKLHVQ